MQLISLLLKKDGTWELEGDESGDRNHQLRLLRRARKLTEVGASARADGMNITYRNIELELELYDDPLG